MADETVCTKGENTYSRIRLLPVLTSTEAAIPGRSGMGAPSISMVLRASVKVTGNTRFCVRLGAAEIVRFRGLGWIALDRLRVGLGDRVMGNAYHLGVEHAAAGEGKGLDLDDGGLARLHEADVRSRHRPRFEAVAVRHEAIISSLVSTTWPTVVTDRPSTCRRGARDGHMIRAWRPVPDAIRPAGA